MRLPALSLLLGLLSACVVSSSSPDGGVDGGGDDTGGGGDGAIDTGATDTGVPGDGDGSHASFTCCAEASTAPNQIKMISNLFI